VVRELKSVAERGLFAPYPGTAQKRFIKALSTLFPSAAAFRIYTDQTRLMAVLEQAGVIKKGEVFSDPAIFLPETATVALWRPFCECVAAYLLVPILPWRLAPAVLVATEGGVAAGWDIPPSDAIAPIALVGATRAIYDLIAEKENRAYPKIAKALMDKECIWKQNGVYLHTDLEGEAYARLFRLFLEAGCLLPPTLQAPAILPSELSEGEEASLARLFIQMPPSP
jgi:hypothetical protein